jgi:hypothetical protein
MKVFIVGWLSFERMTPDEVESLIPKTDVARTIVTVR